MLQDRTQLSWSHRARLTAGSGARRGLGPLLLLAGLQTWSDAQQPQSQQLHALTETPPAPSASAQVPLALTGVTVIDVRTGQRRLGQTVVVTGNRIQAVGSAGEVRVPAGARVMDARGKYLLPGFWDMHVHLNDNADVYYPRFIAHGVTGVREMAQWGNYRGQDFRDLQLDVMDGTVVGPRSVGPSADLSFATPADARRVLDSLKTAGDAFFKYHALSGNPVGVEREVFFAMLREGRRLGLPIVGHVPSQAVTPIEAADSGMRSIEHASMYFHCRESPPDSTATSERCADKARAFRRNGTWLVPTLAVSKYYSNTLADAQESVRKLHSHGVTNFLAGSDYIDAVQRWRPGLSLLEELVYLVDAGLTPLEALQAATLKPAVFFEATDSLGTVEPGKLADLVLLDADPLADIRHVMTTRAVVANGRYFDSAALERLDPDGTRRRAELTPEP